MKKIILFFYTIQFGDKIHPFIIDEVKNLKLRFNEIHIVCLESKVGYGELLTMNNVYIHPIKRHSRYLSLITLFSELIKTDVRKEIKKAKNNKDFSFKFLISLFKIVIPGRKMANIAKKIIKKNKNINNWCVDSYWFDSSAYAAALLKDHNKNIIAITRAHGIEIDSIRNKYMKYEMKSYIISKLNYICFISSNRLSDFKKNFWPEENKKFEKKYKVYRLGVEKIFDSNSSVSDDGTLRIVTCSRMNPVKRLPLLAKSLLLINDIKIEWTHFGIGEDYDKIKEISNKFPSNIKIKLMGNCDNKRIHKYYSSSCVDLFMNVSYSEGIPVSIMEALAYGIPVIATNVGGLSEIIDKKNGILISPNITEEELAKIIKKFYYLNDEKKKEMKYNALKKWEDCFSKKNNNKPFLNILYGGESNEKE